MLPLVKLVVVSKSGEEACFLQKLACLSSFSLNFSKKQPYLVSTSSSQLSVKSILLLTRALILQKSRDTKWQIATKRYAIVILDNKMM